MKTIFIFALLIALSFAVTNKRPFTQASITKFNEMKKQKSWGGIMMNLAELHLQAQGPVDELMEAIEEVIADLDRKTEKAHTDYDTATKNHEAEVARINGQIDNANSDIARSTDLLNNVLYIQKQQLETDIANLEQSIVDTQNHIASETQIREEQTAKFVVQIQEHREALEAVHEALEVLSQLFEGDSAASLIQVKKAQKSIEKVQKKLNQNAEASLIKALLSLSTNQFSDQSDVGKVAELLHQVQQNLENSIDQLTLQEETSQANFETDMKLSAEAIVRMTNEITDNTALLEQTNSSIEENLEFIELRQRDLAEYEQDLVDENENFEVITQQYEDLLVQLEAEEQACNQALSVLQSGNIEGYIGDRMEQDVIIDQPHGMGITVESDPFDLE